jgi:DnaJ-class molecular chaperone
MIDPSKHDSDRKVKSPVLGYETAEAKNSLADPEVLLSMCDDVFGKTGEQSQLLEVTAEEAKTGVLKKVQASETSPCDICNGTGSQPQSPPIECATCMGRGCVGKQWLGGMFRTATTCRVCKGKGKIIVNACVACGGEGEIPRPNIIVVNVPAGTLDGEFVNISDSESNKAVGKKCGVAFRIKIREGRADSDVAVPVRDTGFKIKFRKGF